MLNTNEHGLAVRCIDHAGNFAVVGAGHKAADFLAVRVGAAHDISANVDPIACSIACLVGLNPQAAKLVEPQTVRRTKVS